jgi:DNA invertase Pin-like site-specific DNA recombinase
MKVAIYTRTSTDRQQSGLESQKRALVEFCKARSITEYLVFEDFGVSGTKNSRPELDKLLIEVRCGRVNTVIVYSFSRFARSTKFLIDTLDEFGKLKVNFISLSENVDLSTAIGRAMYTIISAIGKKIGRPVTVNQELIVTLKNEGYTYRQIGKMLGVGQGSITNALNKNAQKGTDHGD